VTGMHTCAMSENSKCACAITAVTYLTKSARTLCGSKHTWTQHSIPL